MRDLEGKLALLTGAGGGIGQACARELARAGAQLILSDVHGADLRALVEDVGVSGAKAEVFHCDLRVEEEIVQLVGFAEQAGGVDILVNNAAGGAISQDGAVTTMTTAVWDDIFAVNLRSQMITCREVVPGMLQRGGGSIINMSSTAGFLGDLGLTAYSATKAGIASLTRSVATAYGKNGVRCNAIAPGSIVHGRIREMMGAETVTVFERTRLVPRLGEPADIAHLTCFLASERAAYITGQVIFVDGGGGVHQPWFPHRLGTSSQGSHEVDVDAL